MKLAKGVLFLWYVLPVLLIPRGNIDIKFNDTDSAQLNEPPTQTNRSVIHNKFPKFERQRKQFNSAVRTKSPKRNRYNINFITSVKSAHDKEDDVTRNTSLGKQNSDGVERLIHDTPIYSSNSDMKSVFGNFSNVDKLVTMSNTISKENNCQPFPDDTIASYTLGSSINYNDTKNKLYYCLSSYTKYSNRIPHDINKIGLNLLFNKAYDHIFKLGNPDRVQYGGVQAESVRPKKRQHDNIYLSPSRAEMRVGSRSRGYRIDLSDDFSDASQSEYDKNNRYDESSRSSEEDSRPYRKKKKKNKKRNESSKNIYIIDLARSNNRADPEDRKKPDKTHNAGNDNKDTSNKKSDCCCCCQPCICKPFVAYQTYCCCKPVCVCKPVCFCKPCC